MAYQTVRGPSPVLLGGALATAGPLGQCLCRGRYEVLRLGQAVSLVTFFAAAKKVTAAPHRGSANRPTRIQVIHRRESSNLPPLTKRIKQHCSENNPTLNELSP